MYEEKHLRKLTLDLIQSEYGLNDDSRVVEEMGLAFGDSRIDVAIINGKMIGYEIKSDFDTLKRLPRQIEMYQRYFDKVSLVTTAKHLDEVVKITPLNWGIYVAKTKNQKNHLYRIRAAKKNLNTDVQYVVQLLWKNEALDILEQRGFRGCRGKNKEDLYNLILSSFPSDSIKNIVRCTLKGRTTWRVG